MGGGVVLKGAVAVLLVLLGGCWAELE